MLTYLNKSMLLPQLLPTWTIPLPATTSCSCSTTSSSHGTKPHLSSPRWRNSSTIPPGMVPACTDREQKLLRPLQHDGRSSSYFQKRLQDRAITMDGTKGPKKFSGSQTRMTDRSDSLSITAKLMQKYSRQHVSPSSLQQTS